MRKARMEKTRMARLRKTGKARLVKKERELTLTLSERFYLEIDSVYINLVNKVKGDIVYF